MTILGTVLFVIGVLTPMPMLQAIGLVLAAVGLMFSIVAALDIRIGRRRHYF